MRRVVVTAALAGFAATLSGAHTARAQVWNQIKESTAKKVEARKEHPDSDDRLAAMLKNGRDVELAAGSDAVPERAAGTLRGVAGALKEMPGTFQIDAHTEPGGDPAVALSERRAASVKAKLIELGIPAERLFAIRPRGLAAGAGRQRGDTRGASKIEVARMQ